MSSFEALVGLLVMGGVAWVILSQGGSSDAESTTTHTDPPATTSLDVPVQPRLVFAKTETVTVTDPHMLADEIERVRRSNTGNIFGTNYVLGEPQITADGCTANIALFREA